MNNNEFLTADGLEEYNRLMMEHIEKNKTKLIDFSLRIEDGNLICDYPEGSEKPNLTINSEGFLVFTTE